MADIKEIVLRSHHAMATPPDKGGEPKVSKLPSPKFLMNHSFEIRLALHNCYSEMMTGSFFSWQYSCQTVIGPGTIGIHTECRACTCRHGVLFLGIKGYKLSVYLTSLSGVATSIYKVLSRQAD